MPRRRTRASCRRPGELVALATDRQACASITACTPAQTVSPYYDPMLAKIIAHGATREEARRRLVQALASTIALGIATNRAFLIDCLDHPDFVAGRATTQFIPKHFARIARPKPILAPLALAAVLCFEASAQRFGHDPVRTWSSSGALAWPLALEAGAGTTGIARSPCLAAAAIGSRTRRKCRSRWNSSDERDDAFGFEVDGQEQCDGVRVRRRCLASLVRVAATSPSARRSTSRARRQAASGAAEQRAARADERQGRGRAS